MKREPPRDSLVSILLPLGLIFGLVLLKPQRWTNQWEPSPSSPLEFGSSCSLCLAAGAEIAAALVIGGAVLRGIGAYLHQLLKATY